MVEQRSAFTLPEAIAVLERTPVTLAAMLRGLPDAWLVSDEGPDTFTAMDNVGHLIHGERVDWIPRARIILKQGADRRFTPFDRYAHRLEMQGMTISQLLDSFTALRAENLATLRAWNLTDRQLDLEAEHPALGTVNLGQLLSAWTVHDLGHIAQIARVMSKRYRASVGPWREYLPILDRA